MSAFIPPTVADGFASYWRAVVPADAPEVQVTECRRAFYAGAWNMYCALVVHTADLDDAEGERYLEALRDELVAFKAAVGTPREVRGSMGRCPTCGSPAAGLYPKSGLGDTEFVESGERCRDPFHHGA